MMMMMMMMMIVQITSRISCRPDPGRQSWTSHLYPPPTQAPVGSSSSPWQLVATTFVRFLEPSCNPERERDHLKVRFCKEFVMKSIFLGSKVFWIWLCPAQDLRLDHKVNCNYKTWAIICLFPVKVVDVEPWIDACSDSPYSLSRDISVTPLKDFFKNN